MIVNRDPVKQPEGGYWGGDQDTDVRFASETARNLALRWVVRLRYGFIAGEMALIAALAFGLLSYTYSTSLDNVGEFFFSSPVHNFNIWQDYGRSDDDQRHRFVFDGTIHSSVANPTTFWQRISSGFQLNGMLQYYSALPFNITAGTTTVQGTTARPVVNGAFISRNAGTGFDFFNVNARLSRTFQTTERFRLQAMVEAFNLFNHVNGVALNGSFGAGTFPVNPSPNFKQITAVADPRTLQFGLRLSF